MIRPKTVSKYVEAIKEYYLRGDDFCVNCSLKDEYRGE